MTLEEEFAINKLYVGNVFMNYGQVYLGNTQVKQIYVGTKKIYDHLRTSSGVIE